MRIIVFVMSLLLLGCAPDDDGKDEDSVLYDAAKEPLDKAEAVQDAALEAKDRVDAAVEDSEGSTDD